MEQVETLQITTKERIEKRDRSDQQLLGKPLGVEQDLNGKLGSVTDDVSSLAIKLGPWALGTKTLMSLGQR